MAHIVITGADRGIGPGLARQYAAGGDRVRDVPKPREADAMGSKGQRHKPAKRIRHIVSKRCAFGETVTLIQSHRRHKRIT